MTLERQQELLVGATPEQLAFWHWQLEWLKTARPDQLPPDDVEWTEFGARCGRGFGKRLCVETPIPTPSGWCRMGDLKVGQQVFDEAGKPCKVLGVYDGWPETAWRLHFSDGSTLDADGEHQWVTWTHRERKQYLRSYASEGMPANWPAWRQPLMSNLGEVIGEVGPQVRTTTQIVDTLRINARQDTNHCVPVCGDLCYPEADLPLDPWLLGYWLGNGSKRDGAVSCHHDDTALVRQRFEAAGFAVTPLAGCPRDFYVKQLAGVLRALGLVNDKHVPAPYLQAGVEQRRALLAGLLDSDGHCTLRAGHIEFTSMDRVLADGVVELARSLGQKPVLGTGCAMLNGKDCGKKYRVKWRSTYQPFALPRKAAAWREPGAQKMRNQHRMIVSAERIEPKPMRCITVDSPNSLFLAGEAMIPTHNTRMGAEWLGRMAWENTEGLPCGVIAPTQRDVRFVCFEGEALALDTPIATPSGWSRFGDLRVGDAVFSDTGEPTRIVAVSPIWYDRPCYAVSFGGETIVADAKHLWATQTAHDRGVGGRFKVRATERIAKSAKGLWHRTPEHGPLALPEAILPVPPYTLGAWLGDGGTRGDGAFASHDDDHEVRDRIKVDGFGVNRRVGGHAWGIVGGLKAALRARGLNGNKFIPAEYLRASAAQRLELLRGLMDTDGYVSKRGQCAFDNTNKKLVEDVCELLTSLGFKASAVQEKLNKGGHKTMYRVVFEVSAANPIPFCLSRKARRCSPSARGAGRVIRSVTPAPSVPVRCIQVANANGLFLVGRSMVVTHNSGLLSVIPPDLIEQYASSDLYLRLKNGATIYGYSAEKADRLRGPQHFCLWCDEVAAWGAGAEEAWDMAMFGLRLGVSPRVLWTSTPRPTEFVRMLIKPRERRITIQGSTYDNKANLSETFFDQVAKYEGTRLGRQELYGELIDPEEAGIIKRSWMRLWPAKKNLPVFDWIIMSLDTAYTEKALDSKGDPDPTACGVFGVFRHKDGKGKVSTQVMLLDCWEDWLGLPALMKRVRKEMRARYGGDEERPLFTPMHGSSMLATSGHGVDILLIEDKGSGISLRQMLMENGIEAYAYNPGRADKLSRLHIVSPLFAQRRVWLPESEMSPGKPRTWCEPLIAQLCAFAGDGSIRHDDFVDVVTQALRMCMDRGLVSLAVDKAEERERARREPLDTPREEVINPYAV